jgi:glucose-1-phosphate adenylyltransferase
MSILGVVFSNIHDYNVPELTRHRTMASIPFGGRYRLIDFVLSNMINSNITKVGVITKNNYQSLMDHVGSGKDWDLARKNGGLILLPPFGSGNDSLYNSRLEALKGITSFLTKATDEFVLMTDCDNVCNIDYDKIIDYHIKKKSDITLVYKNLNVTNNNDNNSTVFNVSDNGRITDIAFKPNVNGAVKLFINVYVINRLFLINLIMDAIAHGQHHFTKDILASNVNSLKIYGYEFEGFFAGINSMQSYFSNNMKLLNKDVRNDLFGNRNVYTKIRDSAPTKYGAGAQVNNSLISDGCLIEGEVVNSILFRGVKIGRGTIVKNSILMQDAVTGENASLNCVIADKNVVIRDNRILSGCDVQPFFIAKGSMV